MRIALVLAVLAACGGGGGGGDSTSAPFNASQDLAATHPWLDDAEWRGTITVDGVSFAASLFVSPIAAPTEQASGSIITLAPFIPSSATLQADGGRVRITASAIVSLAEGTTVLFEGAASPGGMSLSWRRFSTVATLDGDTGTATLAPAPQPVVLEVEVYDTPELLLVVRRECR